MALTKERIDAIAHGSNYTLNEHTELCQLAAEALRTREASAAARERLRTLTEGAPPETEETPPLNLSPEFYESLAEDDS